MTTINTTEDLLQLVREDETFRAAMRRELLTTELLEVPQRLDKLEQNVAALIEHANATNARLDRMDQTIAAIVEQTNAINRRLDVVEADIAVMKADIAETRSDIVVMKADIAETKSDIVVMKADIAETKSDITEMKGDITVIKRDINGLGESFRREVKAQSSYRGNYAQSAASASDIDIAYLFARRHGLEAINTRHISRNTLAAWLRDNRDLIKSLNIRQRAMRTFLRPDIIASVEDLYSGDGAATEYYIVVEASYTGEVEDIDKATDHAKIIRAVTGLEAYPVVAGAELDYEMDEEARHRLYVDVEQFVEANDPNAAYLYRLDSADMRPLEPR